jgi:hypothetical protein
MQNGADAGRSGCRRDALKHMDSKHILCSFAIMELLHWYHSSNACMTEHARLDWVELHGTLSVGADKMLFYPAECSLIKPCLAGLQANLHHVVGRAN